MERQIKSMHLQHRLIQRLNNEKVELSYTLLAGYLLNHYDELSELSVEQVCEDNFISKSTLRRFCQSLGYENFTDLKDSKQEVQKYNITYPVNLTEEVKKQLNELNFNEEDLIEISNCMKEHELIFVLFPSNLYSAAYSFQQQFTMINKYVCLVPNIDNIYPYITKGLENSLVIILDTNIEYTQEALFYLKDSCCKKIAISNYEDLMDIWDHQILIQSSTSLILEKYTYSVVLDELFLSFYGLGNVL